MMVPDTTTGPSGADAAEQTNPLQEEQERLEAYIEGSREHDYYAADGRFRAHFPVPPIREEYPTE